MPLSDERIGILVLKQLLQFIDLFCITMFYIEIWLKCASSSFKNFYKDSWNIFDLVITTLVLYIATMHAQLLFMNALFIISCMALITLNTLLHAFSYCSQLCHLLLASFHNQGYLNNLLDLE